MQPSEKSQRISDGKQSEVGDRYLGSVFRYFGTIESEIWYRIPNYRMTTQITEIPVMKVGVGTCSISVFRAFLKAFWFFESLLKAFEGLLKAF